MGRGHWTPTNTAHLSAQEMLRLRLFCGTRPNEAGEPETNGCWIGIVHSHYFEPGRRDVQYDMM